MKEIQLTKGLVALVDDEDAHLGELNWFANEGPHKTYAQRREGWPIQRTVYMHRVIVNAPEGMVVDHINGNGLDNRRKNLRICTTSENMQNRGKQTNNSTGYKGVSWRERERKYRAQIQFKRKMIDLGCFVNPEDAARAYDKKARELYGEFANTNFPSAD